MLVTVETDLSAVNYLDCPFNIDKYDCKDITEEMWRNKFETFK